MDAALHTFPNFYALAQNPQLRGIVIPTLRRYGGDEAVRDYVSTKRTMVARGIDSERSQNTALYLASARADQRVADRNLRPLLVGVVGPTGKMSKKARRIWKKVGRAAGAVATGGASEAVYQVATNEDLRRKIKDAASRGWGSFEEAVKDSLRAFTKVKDWRDVLDIVKVVLSAGASVAQDTIIIGIQEALMELLDPYLKEASKMMGKNYGKGRRGLRKAAQKLVRRMNGNETAERIMGEFVNAIWDLVLGLPMCMLEKACIQPVATALSKVEVPYVKAIGEALKVIYPIMQGNYGGSADEPQSSQALFMYASGEVPLLPNAKLPAGSAKTLKNILEVLDEKADWSIAMPTAFNRFSPYLIDLVARGQQGPYVYGSSDMRSKKYMARPWAAEKVIKNANKISGLLDSVDKYLRKINRYVEMGKQAYDVYSAIDMEDFSFDMEEWNAEDLKALLGDKVSDLQSWAVKETDSYQRRAMEAFQSADKIAQRVAMRKVNKYKDLVTSTTKSFQTTVSNLQDPDKRSALVVDARSRAGKAAIKAQADAEARARQSTASITKPAQSLKGRLFVPPKFSFGATGAAQSFMGEWMIAHIGLAARARYNDMAQLWLESTPAERSRWTKAPARRWKDEAIDYPEWHKKFKKSAKMRRMVIAQAAHKMPMAKLSLLLQVAETTGNSAVVPVLREVVNSRGKYAGIANLAQIGIGITRNSIEQSAHKAVEEGLVSQAEIDAYTGKKPTWLVPAVIAGTAVTGAAVLVALTE